MEKISREEYNRRRNFGLLGIGSSNLVFIDYSIESFFEGQKINTTCTHGGSYLGPCVACYLILKHEAEYHNASNTIIVEG